MRALVGQHRLFLAVAELRLPPANPAAPLRSLQSLHRPRVDQVALQLGEDAVRDTFRISRIVRKPAASPLVLAGSLQCPSGLVSRDLSGWGGIGRNAAGRDGCSHSVPIRRAPCLAGLRVPPVGHKGGTVSQAEADLGQEPLSQ